MGTILELVPPSSPHRPPHRPPHLGGKSVEDRQGGRWGTIPPGHVPADPVRHRFEQTRGAICIHCTGCDRVPWLGGGHGGRAGRASLVCSRVRSPSPNRHPITVSESGTASACRATRATAFSVSWWSL